MSRHRWVSWVLAVMMGAVSLPLAAPAAAETAEQEQARVQLYQQFLELEGAAARIRAVVDSVKAETAVGVAAEYFGGAPLTGEDLAEYETIAGPIFAEAEKLILLDLAVTQSAAFTPEEIQELINLNSLPVVIRYNALRAASPDQPDLIQGFMVDAVVNIVQAFQDNAAPGAVPQLDTLASQLLRVDGTAESTRGLFSVSYLPMIVEEVAKYIDFSALSPADNERLAQISKAEIERLTQRTLELKARSYAEALSEDDIRVLISAYDTPTNRKLSKLREEDDGSIDARSEITIENAVYNVYVGYMFGPF